MNTTTTLESVREVMERQHAIVTRAQLSEAGFSNHRIRGLLATQRIRPLRRNVYTVVGAPATFEQRLLAVVLFAGPGAVASHTAAAQLWDFARLPPYRLEVTVPGEMRVRLKDAAIHRSVRLEAIDRTAIRGIPCTTFERTVCDTTTALSFTQLGRVLDEGLRRGVTTLTRVHACVERLDSGPGRRLTPVKQLLAERGHAYEPGGSGEELRVLQTLRAAGLPLPVQQHEVAVGGASYVLDFAWPELKVFVEWYGLPYHIGAAAVVGDSARLTALVAEGWTPLVFTSRSPTTEIVGKTRAALALAAQVWASRVRQGA